MIKCFIACAFGKKDVDELYRGAILAVLKERNITALRVDKIEHNSNIDTKIIDLVKNSDICIADLTYSRPSVYFEAGYSAGLKHPVIYTVRKDHLDTQDKRTGDALTVHFDLKMKNIIDWPSSVKIATFKKRLSKRINFVCTPLWKREEEIRANDAERSAFAMMSLDDRLRTVREKMQQVLLAKKWKPHYWNDSQRQSNIVDYFVKGKKIAGISVFESATKHDMSRKNAISVGRFADGHEFHHLIVGIRKIPNTRIESTFQSAVNIERCRILRATTYNRSHYYLHFISGLEHARRYIEEMANHLKQISR
jgi:nucleoside 2-deoxyribosyltransferase